VGGAHRRDGRPLAGVEPQATLTGGGPRGAPREAGDAAAGYRHVLDGWHQLGHAYEEAFTAIDMASVFGPDHEEVRQAAERARDIFGRMGAAPFLERLEATLSRTPGRVDPAAAEVTAAGAAG